MDIYSIYPKQFNNAAYKLQSDSCFVVMPFSEDLDNTYMVIDSVASSLNIKCTRADNVSTTSEPILNKICSQISQAYFIIVDITNLNPNVFYELGIAHVLRDANKVLIIKEEQTQCPSDIRHIHYYAYNKSNLKHLKETIENFFKENNILGDLHSLLNFLDLAPKDTALSQSFVVSLSNCMGNNMDTLVMILNNRLTESTQNQVIGLLSSLTQTLNDMSLSDDLNPLYSELILLIITKTVHIFDLSEYISQLFSGKYNDLPNEWLADCSIAFLDLPNYYDRTISWIIEYLKESSPAEFDIAKYKLEIGIIKSKSDRIDSTLVNNLRSQNKTLAEHCAKLIKERKTYTAIPILLELVEKEENPYVVRSSIDALVKFAPLAVLIKAKNTLSNRLSFVESYGFLCKHLVDLNEQISHLQNASY